MRVLIGCEFSGRVRDAFIRRGHDAVSCDLLPTEVPGPHIQGDVLEHLNDGWDLMIAHPPCTYISYVGTRHWNNPGRLNKRLEALQFFAQLWEAPIERICIESPRGCASPTIAKYTQLIHPYYFGDSATKATCLWLKNLPLLRWSHNDSLFERQTATAKPEPMYLCQGEKSKGKKITWSEGMRGVADRSKARSETFLGIAEAMSSQWGEGKGSG